MSSRVELSTTVNVTASAPSAKMEFLSEDRDMLSSTLSCPPLPVVQEIASPEMTNAKPAEKTILNLFIITLV